MAKKCYINNPYSDAVLPSKLTKANTLFYPESSMTTHQMMNSGRPKDFHIVTDCHFLIPLYSGDEVFYWEDGEWVNPRFQTYGCSYNMILNRLWGGSSIPQAVIDGKITNVMGRNFQ